MATDKRQVDFNFDTYKSENQHEPFDIVIDGKAVQLPPAAELPGVEFFENALRGDAYATTQMLKTVLDADQYAKLRKVATIESLQAFVKGYLAASGLGKAG